MPLVRIALPAGRDEAYARMISQGVQDAMVATIDVPADDFFQVVTEHLVHGLRVDPNFFGIARSNEAILVNILMRRGRTDAQKRALYKAIVGNLATRGGLRPQDVVIVLHENELIDWSFGEGLPQYLPEEGA